MLLHEELIGNGIHLANFTKRFNIVAALLSFIKIQIQMYNHQSVNLSSKSRCAIR